MVDNLLSIDPINFTTNVNFLQSVRSFDNLLSTSSPTKTVDIKNSEQAQSFFESSQTIDINASVNVKSDNIFNVPALDPADIIASATEFSISYIDGSPKTFKFSLLPAVEVRGSTSTAQVPEIKPGILMRTSMNQKRFSIPGGPPVFQTLGVEQTILQMVGMFIGNEGINNTEGVNSASALYNINAALTANKTASFFDREIVQRGSPVKILIASIPLKDDSNPNEQSLVLSYNALIQSVRYFYTRVDRVYYAVDALLLDYKQYGVQVEKPNLNIVSNVGKASNTNIPVVGADGKPVLDINGKPLTLDEKGAVVDSSKLSEEPKLIGLDKNGNAVLDKDGKPVIGQDGKPLVQVLTIVDHKHNATCGHKRTTDGQLVPTTYTKPPTTVTPSATPKGGR